MEKYITVKIPVLDDVDEMKVVNTFNEEQLWYVCALAHAYEKLENENKQLKEDIKSQSNYQIIIDDENAELREEKDGLYNALIITRTKYNNDKARYRRKAKRYKSILTELEEWLKENAGICRLNQKYITNQIYGLKEDTYYRCLNKIQELKEKYK